MYKLMVPVMGFSEGLAKELIRAGTDEVLVVFPRVLRNAAMLGEKIQDFLKAKEYFEGCGIKTGAWLVPSIGYGGTGEPSYSDNDAYLRYTKIKSTTGYEVFSYCPLDQRFVADFLNTVCSLVKVGTDFIMFEDDFTLSGGKMAEVGCCCDRHMKKYRELVGKSIDIKELRQRLLFEGENKYRDAWLKLQGKTLEDFTSQIERAVHEINPKCRIGLSANSSSFLLEGTDISRLAEIVAGDNKPFIRLTGAPYWKNAMTQASNIDAIRLQVRWRGKDIELVFEADTYPRPRSWGPSSHMEMYDMILRADGATDGILKYMTDYVSNIHFEPGYIDRHVANGQRYKEIEKRFSGKTTVGLDIIEKTDTFRKMDFSKDVSFSEYSSRGYLPTMSQWFLCDNSIPTAYGRHGCAHIAFGVNAEYLTEQDLADGIITDAQGAEILMRKGIDVGIKATKKADVPSFEYFIPEDDFTYADTDRPGKFYEYTLDEKATVMSEFIRVDVSGLLPDTDSMRKSDKRFSACHIYENAARQRFMIYSFVPHSVYVTSDWHRGLFRNYYRQKQLAKGIEFLQKRPLPAMCFGAPELYILCKKSEGEMSIGLWNIYPDSVLKPEIYLNEEYTSADFYNYSGKICENKIILDGIIRPYDFCFITVKK